MVAAGIPMPGEESPKGLPKVSTRWEGTHTYKKPEATKRKARTVAQLREEAAANSKANREEAISRRRGSIGGGGDNTPTTKSTPARRSPDLRRRGSTGGLPVPLPSPVRSPPVITLPEEEADAMPGSSKKKRTGSGQSDGEASDGVDPALKRFLNAMKNDLMDTTKEAVGRLETRLERNEASIASLEKRVERGENVVEEKILAAVKLHCKPTATQPAPAAGKRDSAYDYCRRSLRIWPIEGDNMEDAVRCFLKDKLGLTDGRIRSLGGIEVSSMPGKLSRERREVLATFETREDRDSVKVNGVNLAGQREVGMSLHVPGYLMDNLVALNGLGYAIKQKNPDVKRSVKFDDQKRDLYLDICISGQWKRVTPAEAKEVLKEVPNASTASSTSISVAELAGLVRGKPLVVVADEDMED